MQEMEFDEIFDETEEVEETEEIQEEHQEEIQEDDQNLQEEKTEPFLTVRFNKEDRGLTHDEAVTLAQKGMNYDHIFKENQSLRQLNNHIQALADSNGMNIEDYLNHLNTVQDNFFISKELNALKEKYPDADDELLKELAKSNVSNARASQRQEQTNIIKQQEEARSQEAIRQVKLLENRYPDVDINKLVENSAFMGYVADGYSVLEAYQLMKEDERAIIEKNAQKNTKNIENKSRSLGNTTNSGDDVFDDFLSGFDSI